MMTHIPAVLTPQQVAEMRGRIDAADWTDGNVTSGFQAALAKRNRQLPQNSEAARAAGGQVVSALHGNPLFTAAALPRTVLPPLFNRYGPGEAFGMHVDNSVRRNPATGEPIRCDLSATLFLSDPESYEGGELVVEDTFGAHSVKLAAGDMILYPSSSLHRVEPIRSGERVAAFFWIQSLVRDDACRTLLLDMDMAIQGLAGTVGQDDPAIISMTGVYHNLLRMWAEV